MKPLRSMTGFGQADENGYHIEIKGVNHRYRDVRVRLPKDMTAYEIPVRDLAVACALLHDPLEATAHSHEARAELHGELARRFGAAVADGVAALSKDDRLPKGERMADSLRRIRLQLVRRDLLAAGPEERVTDVAMRWGFYHLGRFSRLYAAQFGELPSATHRRSQSGAARAPQAAAVGC